MSTPGIPVPPPVDMTRYFSELCERLLRVPTAAPAPAAPEKPAE